MHHAWIGGYAPRKIVEVMVGDGVDCGGNGGMWWDGEGLGGGGDLLVGGVDVWCSLVG